LDLKLKFNFIIIAVVMACLLHPAPGAALEKAPAASAAHPAPVPPPMTRCECAELSFEEIARQVKAPGSSLEDVGRRTGCGQTCTACLGDLRRFLGSSL
jgi:bacterioferritin-associated ferredoxin